MKKVTILFILLLFNINIQAQIGTLLEWGFDTDLEGWTLKPQLDGTVSSGILYLTANDNDPYMFSPPLNILATVHTEIMIRMKNNTTNTGGQFFFTTITNPVFTGDLLVDFTTIPNDSGFTDYYIDMTTNDNWEGTITQIRFDPGLSGTYEVDFIRTRGEECEPQSIDFMAIDSKLTSDLPFSIEAIASSGLAVEYGVQSGPATILENVVTLTGQPGYVILTANQEGDVSYCEATETIQSFYVNTPGYTTVSAQIITEGDQWVAKDGLGRILSKNEDVGDTRPDKYVGIFYFIWHGNHNTSRILDLTQLIQENPNAPQYGDQNEFHWWGESEDGYYRADDPWVIRRQLEMLSAAGVDFLYIDVTNGFNYLPTVEALCQVAVDMRSNGIQTPYISFVTKTNSGANMNYLYDNFYAQDLYKDLWFIWDGKPLMFGVTEDEALRTEVRNFFSIRYSWHNTDTESNPNHWQELDEYPQNYGWDISPNIPTQMVVGKALFPIHQLKGDSYQNGFQPDLDQYKLTPFTGEGRHFTEHFEHALNVDPEVIMITGWNEWMAQKQVSGDPFSPYFLGAPTNPGDAYFVDSYNQEFTRDIAPMKGGHTDNHYYLMIDYIRRFKGMAPSVNFSPSQEITIDGAFSEWQSVSPTFKDYKGDIAHRNSPSFANEYTYVDVSGRNDIIETKSTYDNENIYFYVKTAQSLTPSSDPNWMLLFIDSDKDASTGWEGYDYVINKGVISSTETTIKKWNGTIWTDGLAVDYTVNGSKMEISIPRADIEIYGTPQFYFHWMDNPSNLDDISAFFVGGDSAPARRFNYDYSPLVIVDSKETLSLKNQKPFVYPNPAKNNIHIHSNGNIINEVVISDVQGKIIYSDNQPFSNEKLINIQSWKRGIYLVQFIEKERISTQKIIVN